MPNSIYNLNVNSDKLIILYIIIDSSSNPFGAYVLASIYWNKRIFLKDSMSFHGFLCDFLPMSLIGSRRFSLKDYLSVISRRFYPSIKYIISQSPSSYLRINILSPSTSTGYGPRWVIKHPNTHFNPCLYSFFITCGICFNYELCNSVLWLQKRLFKVGIEATKSKSTSFISSLAKQIYSESNQIFFSIEVETNWGSRRKKICLGKKVKRRPQHCIEAGGRRHCGKIGHKKNTYLKMYLKLIFNQYTLLEKEILPKLPKKHLW